MSERPNTYLISTIAACCVRQRSRSDTSLTTLHVGRRRSEGKGESGRMWTVILWRGGE
jgi:hypothetical protein